MPTAHSVTFDQGFSSSVPCVVHILCVIKAFSTYISRVDFFLSHLVSPTRVSITAFVTREKTRSHAKACLSTKIYIRFLKNRS